MGSFFGAFLISQMYQISDTDKEHFDTIYYGEPKITTEKMTGAGMEGISLFLLIIVYNFLFNA